MNAAPEHTPLPARVDVSLSQGVTIEWEDGHTSTYSIRALRQACPCATCNDLHGTGEPPTTKLAPGALPMYQPTGSTLTSVNPVGQYALHFVFSDGHSTGIYTWEYLRQLCPCETCQGAIR